jgi:O-antigen/teichoic acid export membrane protein
MIANEPWNPRGERGALKGIYSVGVWAVAGAAIHWSFTQGYNYIVAGMLSVNDVAAIAATRILMMPVNLVSAGVSTFMFPTVASWLKDHRVPVVLKRVYLLTVGLVLVAVCYLLVLWLLRDWIFTTILKKHFENRDVLLVLWSVICIAMVMRDQLAYTLIAHARFRRLSAMAAVSAVVAISTSVVAMQRYGQPGALIGILIGEGLSVIGIVIMALRDAREVSPVAAGA